MMCVTAPQYTMESRAHPVAGRSQEDTEETVAAGKFRTGKVAIPRRIVLTKQHAKTIASAARVAAIVVLLIISAATLVAHEVPSDVIVRSFLKAEDQRLELLVRVPLESIRDLVFPTWGPGYLKISEADETLRNAATVWIGNQVGLFENGRRLENWSIRAARVSLPSDPSFRDYESALQHMSAARLADDERLMWNQALLDVRLSYEIESPHSEFSIDPNFFRLGLRTTTVLRFVTGEGVERPFEFSGNPGVVRLDPRWHHAFFHFVGVGFGHILDGSDHLLFILCLIIPFRRLRPLIVIVTSFTVAHSITLLSSAFGLAPKAAWFPPLIETMIAASIVYMALENMLGSRWQRRWLVAFGFGLVHGFGFAFALSETLQFAGTHLLTSLFAFNLGVEFGQLFVILLAVPLINLLFRSMPAERAGTILLSALLAHSGWHWMSDRFAALRAYQFRWPALDAALAASVMRWLLLLILTGLALRMMYGLYKNLLAADEQSRQPGGK